MSVEKNEVVSAVPAKANTELKLNKLDGSVKFDESKESQGNLKKSVERSFNQKESKEAHKLAVSMEKSSVQAEKIARPKPEQAKKNNPGFVRRQWNSITSAPSRAIASFRKNPGESSLKVGTGVGLAAGAAYLATGITIAGSTIAAPIVAGALGLTAGVMASRKLIAAVKKRWGGTDEKTVEA
jgi:hypothetical protein